MNERCEEALAEVEQIVKSAEADWSTTTADLIELYAEIEELARNARALLRAELENK
jgi:hypothetical protein